MPTLKAVRAVAAVHSSSILRAPDDEARRADMQRFVADRKNVAARLRTDGADVTRGS